MSILSRITSQVLSKVLVPSALINTQQEPSRLSRYFTFFKSISSTRFNIPTVPSGQSVTMDVYPTNGNSGLPSGSPAVVNNVFQTITFTLTADMDHIGFDGSAYFDGYIANVSVAGRMYEIGEDFSTATALIDSLLSQNGTLSNISESSLLYKNDVDDWEGDELITQAVWENPDTVGSEWTFTNDQWTLTGSGGVNGLRLLTFADQPDILKITGNLVSLSGGNLRVTLASSPFLNSTGLYDVTVNKHVSSQRFARVSGSVNATLDKPSMKHYLKVA